MLCATTNFCDTLPKKAALSLSLDKFSLLVTYQKPLDWLGCVLARVAPKLTETSETFEMQVPLENIRECGLSASVRSLAYVTAAELVPVLESNKVAAESTLREFKALERADEAFVPCE